MDNKITPFVKERRLKRATREALDYLLFELRLSKPVRRSGRQAKATLRVLADYVARITRARA
jgi:hypothetical protein